MSWKVIEILKGIRSSIGLQEVIKSSWKILQRSESIRSSDLPKFLKGSRKSSKSQENAQKVPKVLRTQVLNWFLKMSSNSSKGHQSPRSPQRSTKGIQGDLNSSKRYQRPQNPVVVKSSSNGHQMVLTESSNVPKNSPQMFHKKSSKVPERFFNVLRSSCPQVFKKSSKGPQSPQKVKKMHKRYPRSSGLRFSNDPQNVLYFFKRASNPSKSS